MKLIIEHDAETEKEEEAVKSSYESKGNSEIEKNREMMIVNIFYHFKSFLRP